MEWDRSGERVRIKGWDRSGERVGMCPQKGWDGSGEMVGNGIGLEKG